MHFSIRPCRPDELPLVLEMSNDFVREDCCNDMVFDSLELLAEQDILLALDGDTPIGYAYGGAAVVQHNQGSIRKGQKCFYLDEMYVRPAYRAQSVGGLLFQALKQRAIDLGCAGMICTAVSKDYQRLLRFYERQGMQFWSAAMTMGLPEAENSSDA